MATILEFRAQALRGHVPTDPPTRRSPAQVVIFPGVRYERGAEAPRVKPRSRRSRQRDRLELED